MVAERAPEADRYERAMAVIRELIAAEGLGRFATFDEVGEGEMFPDGTESMSGHVIAEDGRVFFFWTDWDVQAGKPRLGTWREVHKELAGWNIGEYRQARDAVGLS